MDDYRKLILTTSVTVILALIGYIVTYLNNLRLAKRKDKLDRINEQLGEFYGLLYSLMKSSDEAWHSFRQKYRPTGHSFFDSEPPPTREDIAVWRHYMKVVFMPANEKIYDIIVSKSDLLIEDEMPNCLLDLISHIVVYKAVVKNWEIDANTEDNRSIIKFPIIAQEHIYKAFESLKKEQYKMLYRQWA